MLVAIVLLIVTLILIAILVRPKRPSNFPPGPPEYPIVGCGLALTKLGDVSFEVFRKLGEIYGPVTGLHLGGTRAIVINGYEASKEFYTKDNFASRPDFIFLSHPWNGRLLGVFFSSGRLWQEQKRFTLRHLRDFGFGKTSMEGLIHEEVEECIKSIKKAIAESGPSSIISVHDQFNVSIINILWAIMAGKRYSHDDEEFIKLLNVVRESFRAGNLSGMTGNLLNNYRFLRHFPYFKGEFEKVMNGVFAIFKMLDTTIEQHKKTMDPNGEPRDLIDVYLNAIEESKNDPNSTFSRDQLMQICADLFGAGSESTSNSVAYAVLHMLRNPECQAKVQRELDQVVEIGRLPSYDDKANLPYTFAAITESFRMSPVAPISVPHMNTEDVKFMGYDIPKNTWAMVNFPSTNMDKEFWGDPHNFRPERFLDEDGKFVKTKLDHILGFGSGKRQCLGEPLARISNFLFFTGIMQRFKFELIPNQPKPTLDAVEGFTISPHPFYAKVTARF